MFPPSSTAVSDDHPTLCDVRFGSGRVPFGAVKGSIVRGGVV